MLGEIEVLFPGLYSSIQDMGRPDFRKFGVPVSGFMDTFSARNANLILSNSENSPVLEITQLGPKLKFTAPTRISICGANLSPKINEESVTNNSLLIINKGDILTFGKRIIGCRAYLAISGGFVSEKVLGSFSWYEGITEKYRLEKGGLLKYAIEQGSSYNLNASVKIDDNYINRSEIRVYRGPEYDLLTPALHKAIENDWFSVDSTSNRMSIQLKEVLANELEPIITGPVLPGTVQLTPSGKIMVLMRDCQTTGGYPRILQLSEEGMNTIAQKSTGEMISFQLNEIN